METFQNQRRGIQRTGSDSPTAFLKKPVVGSSEGHSQESRHQNAITNVQCGQMTGACVLHQVPLCVELSVLQSGFAEAQVLTFGLFPYYYYVGHRGSIPSAQNKPCSSVDDI